MTKDYLVRAPDDAGNDMSFIARLTEDEAKALRASLGRARRWGIVEEFEAVSYRQARLALGFGVPN